MADDVRVLIADDQAIVRDGLAGLLELLGGITVVGTAVDGAEAIYQARLVRPDVVLMDLNMPLVDGVTATRAILADNPRTRVVVLTTYSDDKSVFDALQAGARGFLTKDAGGDEISHAILTVAAGEAQFDPSVQRRLLEALAAGVPTATVDDMPDALTAREVEVLVEIAAGHSNLEIARRLVVTEATIKTHVNHLLAKTGSRDRAQLVTYAYRHRLAVP